MRHWNNILLALLGIAATASCSDFITEHPQSSLMGDAVFQTPDALEVDIRGVINAFDGDAMYTGNMLEHLHSASGIIHWARSASLGDERWDCLLKLTETSMVLNMNMYRGHYTGINRANVLLKGLENSPVDEAYKKEIAAEAKFYRAVFYFGLVRIYGDVPIRLEPSSAENMACARDPYYKVYAQIVADLEDAWEGMRTPERVEEVTSGQGRPNRWAARSMLASVYLYIGSLLSVPEDDNFYDTSKPGRKPDFSTIGIATADDAWRKALSLSDDVIQHGPYRLADKFSDLFQWDSAFISADGYGAWNSPERIFVLQNNDNNTHNYTAMRSLPQYPEGTQVQSGQYHNRYGNWRPTRFFFQKWCEAYPGAKGTGANNSHIWVSSSDPRFDLSLIHTRFTSCLGATMTLYPNTSRVADFGQAAGYAFFRKYLHPAFHGTSGFADYYFMRLAELYYIAAEAAARLGQTDKAYDYVEVVHARARHSAGSGTATMPAWTKGQFATKEALVNAIIWDKLFELCAEGHEFFETHRLGATWLSEQIVAPVNEMFFDPVNLKTIQVVYDKDAQNPGDFQYPSNPQELRRSILCEFPKEELSYNPALSNADQNDFVW